MRSTKNASFFLSANFFFAFLVKRNLIVPLPGWKSAEPDATFLSLTFSAPLSVPATFVLTVSFRPLSSAFGSVVPFAMSASIS